MATTQNEEFHKECSKDPDFVAVRYISDLLVMLDYEIGKYKHLLDLTKEEQKNIDDTVNIVMKRYIDRLHPKVKAFHWKDKK